MRIDKNLINRKTFLIAVAFAMLVIWLLTATFQ